MSISNEAREAYRSYEELHSRFEAGDTAVTRDNVSSEYQHYLSVHSQHDAPEGYEHYEPYELSIDRRS